MNLYGTDQTVLVHTLICIFCFCIWQKIFKWLAQTAFYSNVLTDIFIPKFGCLFNHRDYLPKSRFQIASSLYSIIDGAVWSWFTLFAISWLPTSKAPILRVALSRIKESEITYYEPTANHICESYEEYSPFCNLIWNYTLILLLFSILFFCRFFRILSNTLFKTMDSSAI